MPCECKTPGWCERHQIDKTPPMHHLCKTSEEWFNKWESGTGPGQPDYDAEGGTPMDQAVPPTSQFLCPAQGCGAQMTAPMQAAGAKVQCPQCNTPIEFVKISETQLVGVLIDPAEASAVQTAPPSSPQTPIVATPQKPPPVARKAWNLAKSLKDFVFDGMKTVTEEQYQERLGICDNCPDNMRKGNHCVKCGCQLNLKARGRAFECPLDHWPKVTTETT